jgi:hypothetical protein
MDAKDLEQIRELFNVGFDMRFEKVEQKMFDWKSEIIDLVDAMAKEIRDEREFRDISSHQIVNNTRRVEKLETKVFGFVGSGV